MEREASITPAETPPALPGVSDMGGKDESILDYAQPDHPSQVFFQRLRWLFPWSMILTIATVPWLICVILATLNSTAGEKKDLTRDTLIQFAFLLPSVAALGCALRECRPSQWRTRRRLALLISVIAGIVSTFFIYFHVSNWYQLIWLDPNGTWDFL